MISRRSKTAVAIFVVGIAAIGAGTWYFSARPKPIKIDFRDQMAVSAGERVYGQTCASCHGVNLEGQTNWRERAPDGKLPAPPHDATGHTWHHSDADLFRIVKFGVQAFAGQDYKTDMPKYQDVLSDEQISAVIAYIKSTWPEKQRAYQEQITEEASDNPGN